MKMTYPVKPHTRANSGDFFIHVFALFPEDLHVPIMVALAELGIDCLLDFLGEDINYLMTELKYKEWNLNPKEKRMLNNVHDWLFWEVPTSQALILEA